jgi:hypothetical protein
LLVVLFFQGLILGSILAFLHDSSKILGDKMMVNGEIAQMIASPIITGYDDDRFATVPQLEEHTEAIKKEFS